MWFYPQVIHKMFITNIRTYILSTWVDAQKTRDKQKVKSDKRCVYNGNVNNKTGIEQNEFLPIIIISVLRQKNHQQRNVDNEKCW